MKRVISCLLAVALLLTLATPVAMAADERKWGAFTYKLKMDGTAAVVGYDWSSTEIFIPNMLDGYIVTEISDNAFNCAHTDNPAVTLLTLPTTVTTIASKAFAGVSFSSYSYANPLNIKIPASVQFIAADAFLALKGTMKFTVEPANPTYASIDGALYNKKQKSLVAYPRTGESIVIPEGIKSIGAYAFYGQKCSPGQTISFPSTLESIGDYAFACSFIPTAWAQHDEGILVLPASVTHIGTGAYKESGDPYDFIYYRPKSGMGYADLKYWNTIDLSHTNLKSIPEEAFSDIYYSSEIILPDTLETIGKNAFYNTRPSDIYSRASDLVIPASVTEISEGAFTVWKPEEDEYPRVRPRLRFSPNSQLRVIGNRAFKYVSFNDSPFPTCVEEIGEEAFADSFLPCEISSPLPLTSLGARAFSGCDNLKSINLATSSLTSIAEEAFLGCNLESVILPENLISIGDKAFCGNRLDSIILPENLTSIGDDAFSRNRLENIILPETLISMGDEAFDANNLSSVTLPSSLTSIGNEVFDNNVYVQTEEGTYASFWASSNGYMAEPVEEDTSWLNN